MLVHTHKIDIKFGYLPVVNYVFQQNEVTLVRQLLIENLTQEELRNIEITLSACPEFASLSTVFIESLAAGKTVQAETRVLPLSSGYLSCLAHPVSGHIRLDVQLDGVCDFSNTYPVELLACDQWSGTTVLPELLAAFVCPHQTVLKPILQRASAILKKWTGEVFPDTYQSGRPDLVRNQMAAIYAAVSEQKILGSTLPVCLQESGQRIRSADVVISQKLGTSLDLAILYASCLEATGIHALLVLKEKQVFAGGWLIPECFPTHTVDDVSFLTKRAAEGIYDIALVETTCMSMGKAQDFDRAVELAHSGLSGADFILSLDIRRARLSGIRPWSRHIAGGAYGEKIAERPSVPTVTPAKPQVITPYDLPETAPEVFVTKQLLWERKLLDLSLRNNLLHIRATRHTLQLISADLHLFEDALAGGEEFRIMSKPADWNPPVSDFGIYHPVPGTDPVMSLIRTEVSRKCLRSYLSEAELAKALTHLYRSSRTSLEENGANTLYLALGFLRWYESRSGERPRYAPILLVPVEIIRKSVAKGYVIRSREEDPIMNITLLEMLKQNFNIHIHGLTPLPSDKSGVDVKLIFSILRNGIKEMARWDVEEQSVLGIFSFNKFTMWNDIHTHADKLAGNKIVSSLINGRIGWEVEEEMADAGELDKHLSPSEVLLPMSADSSQLEAIYEAARDKSFILHGPPGTGKSQTITNLIANALYKGKRVLFVAEKMAALSVVQSRLEAIGLDPFCLELHSNKTKKTAVIGQLRKTAEVVRVSPPGHFKSEADRLLALRTELNGYIEALHKVYPFGWSLYEAITRYQSLEAAETLFDIPRNYFRDLDKETVALWDDVMEQLIMTANACGHPHNHPLTGIAITEYSTEIRAEASGHIDQVLEVLRKIKPYVRFLPEWFGEWAHTIDREGIQMLSGVIAKLLHIPELTSVLLTHPLSEEDLEAYRHVCVRGKERDRFRERITSGFSEGVFALDAAALLVAWNRAADRWFLPRFFAQRKIKRQLKGYTYQPIEHNQVRNTLEHIVRYTEEKEYIEIHTVDFGLLFGKHGRKGNEKWEMIEQMLEDVSEMNDAIFGHARSISVATHLKETLARQLSHGVAPFRRVHGEHLSLLSGLLTELDQKEERLCHSLGITKKRLYAGTDLWIDTAMSRLEGWKANLHRLKEWYQWLLVFNRMDALKIGFVAERYQTDNIETRWVYDSFRKSLYKAASTYIISQDKSLELFNGSMFSEVIEKYRRLTSEFQELTRKELYARLASNLPAFTREATQSSEVGILQRNLRNNARGVSVRRLFDQIPTLLSRMCPCMLMSPISVAQYIDADAEKFDLIVFDEASQMPTYEAVGAIARGKNVVIVGDPKQMPPTSFFAVNTVDEEHIEREDLESILDDCLALSMPSGHLLWHYRSKHESLIAFSNAEYYDNKLLTFPSPDHIDSKVRLVHIDGVYDKGKSRQNRAEAQAVVDEIARRLRDEERRGKSIGVVTFSLVQQSLIEDLLSELFITDPDLETWALGGEEPLFIKNLENVQGDERDIILFSIGYGPDKEGKVSMNFGPLNREGGERRLNVAVSRARYEMIIYSALRSDQIDLSRSSARGVAGLKRFLAYAESGESMVRYVPEIAGPEVSVHAVIAGKLRAEGYTVHTNIGSSGYKIDIGIVDEQDSSRYKLGILCDGDNYKRTKTMRDREIVQTQVLKMLGWKICRVWTLDWWEHPDRVLRKIREAMENEQEHVVPENQEVKSLPVQELHSMAAQPAESVDKKNTGGPQPYRNAVLPPVKYASEEFLEPRCQIVIQEQIRKVLQAEAPVSRSLLCKKILSAWGISRMGQRLDARFEELFRQGNYFRSEHEKNVFYWIDQRQHDQYEIFRIHAEREAIDLPPVEVANAMKHILQDEISLPVTDLLKICGQIFGFARSGSHVEAAMRRGMEEAARRGYLKLENERAVIL